MGRIKSILIKRTAEQLLVKTNESFGDEFNKNKNSLGRTMPSKRIRNRIAGYITRLNRNSQKIIKEEEDGRTTKDE